MPLAQDPENGGTNTDGTKSSEYCSLCYRKGEFCGDFTDARKMQEFVKGKLRERGIPRVVAWFMASDIPRLARWKK